MKNFFTKVILTLVIIVVSQVWQVKGATRLSLSEQGLSINLIHKWHEHRKKDSFGRDSLQLPPKVQREIDSLKALSPLTKEGEDKYKLYGKISWAYGCTHSHLNEALQYADSIRLLGEKRNEEFGLAYSQFYYGFVARFQGNYSKALSHLDQFVQYFASQGDSARVASGLFQVGVIQHNLGNYEKSLAAYYRLIRIHEKNKYTYGIGFTLNSIGIIYKKMKRFDESIKTYQKAIAIFDSLGAKEDLAGSFTNIGNVYALVGKYEKARKSYAQALVLYQQTGSKDGEAINLESLGAMLNLLNKPDSALVYHLQSLAIREKFPQKEQLALSLSETGFTYSKLKKYPLAEKYLQRALSLGKETGAKPLLRDIHRHLASLYADQRQYSKAYANFQLFSAYSDSVFNDASSQQLQELQTRYETQEKDKLISLLAKEKEIERKEAQRQSLQKKASIGVSVLVFIIGLLILYVQWQRQRTRQLLAKKNQEVLESNLRRQMSELEMKALRAQMNPHFIFNCMNSINRMILEGEADHASQYLTKFSKLIRQMLENSESAAVPLQNELALLESYIQLENLRFKEKIAYEFKVDDSIDRENTYLPSMVLQPFVENAIWHGLRHKGRDEAGIIRINIEEKGEALSCVIEDNGVGREKAIALEGKSALKGKSMGIQITEERLKHLSKGRQEPVLHITDLKDNTNHPLGTRVFIHIPLA